MVINPELMEIIEVIEAVMRNEIRKLIVTFVKYLIIWGWCKWRDRKKTTLCKQKVAKAKGQ